MNEISEINWQAFEYEYNSKSTNWFWMVWILAFSIAMTAYLFNNLLFGVFVLVGAFSVSLFASRKPSLISFSLSKKGVLIKNNLIPFSTLESFWIEEDINNKILFKSEKKTSPYIVIPLDKEIDINEVRRYLLEYLEEIEHHESLLQVFMEKLGF
ncbi:MAG: hypothetical protein KAR54_01425 [Candidatus Pacebacteria bacterium]|nr:hypothetical protein [Candidatus Paceibacterota bacterium]